MLAQRWRPRGRGDASLKVVLAVYLMAVVLLPWSHHDFACHLKSSTHCTTCVIGASGETAHDGAGLVDAALAACGQAPGAPAPLVDSCPDGIVAGRSPPARG